MQLYTTQYAFTLEHATTLANAWSKAQDIDGVNMGWRKEYNTCIKGKPAMRSLPECCWAVTNRYDPRVANRISELTEE